MTKSELEIELEKALKTIDEQRHLATAVEAKDKEIAELKEKHQKEIVNLKDNLQKERTQLSQNNNSAIENAIKRYEQENKQLKEELNRRVNELNHLIRLYGNLLKALQGNLDNAIELNEYFINEVNR